MAPVQREPTIEKLSKKCKTSPGARGKAENLLCPSLSQAEVCSTQADPRETLTLRLLRDGAQPVQVDAVLAADAGRAAPEWMQRDCSDDKRQFEEQLGRPRNIHTNLQRQETRGKLSCWCFPNPEGRIFLPQSASSSWPEGNSCGGMQREISRTSPHPLHAVGRCTGGTRDLTQITSPKMLCSSPKWAR